MKASLSSLLFVGAFILPSFSTAQATMTSRPPHTPATVKPGGAPAPIVGMLTMDGKTYRILKCDYSLNRDVDPTGRPASGNRGGRVTISVEGSGDASIWDLMNDPFKTVNGTIAFKQKDAAASMRELSFENAYVVGFSESYDASSERPLVVTFTVSARKITQGASSHQNEWPQ